MTDKKPSDWAWSNVPDDADFPGLVSYEVLRDTIIEAFNPPDDDVAEESLMTDTLDKVWAFIVAQPCSCPPDAGWPEWNAEPCARCDALGRARDGRLER